MHPNRETVSFALSVLNKARLARPVNSVRMKLLDNTIDYVIGLWPPMAHTNDAIAIQHVLNSYDWKERLG